MPPRRQSSAYGSRQWGYVRPCQITSFFTICFHITVPAYIVLIFHKSSVLLSQEGELLVPSPCGVPAPPLVPPTPSELTLAGRSAGALPGAQAEGKHGQQRPAPLALLLRITLGRSRSVPAAAPAPAHAPASARRAVRDFARAPARAAAPGSAPAAAPAAAPIVHLAGAVLRSRNGALQRAAARAAAAGDAG